MTFSSSIQNTIYASLTFKLKASPYTTLTVYVGNRHAPKDTVYSGATHDDIFPLIKSVNNIGLRMGESGTVPERLTGTIVLDNARDTFGYEKRISDLLERYTCIEQAVTVVTGRSNLSGAVSGDFATEFIGTIKRLGINPGGDSLSLDIEGQQLSKRVATKIIQPSGSPFITTPSYNLGKYIPIVFGEGIEVKPLVVDTSNVRFAYATTFADDFPVGGVNKYYGKVATGEYKEIKSAGSTATEVYGDDLSAFVYSAGTLSSELTEDTYRAVDISWASNKAHVITQGYVYFKQAASATIYGSFVFEIWEKDPVSGGPGKLVAQGKRQKDTITMNTGSANKIEFAFDAPVVLGSTNGYFFAVKEQANNGSANLKTARYTGSGTRTYWVFSNNTWAQYVNTVDGDAPKMWWALFGCNFGDTSNPGSTYWDTNGLGHAYVTITQKAVYSGGTNPDLTKLDLVFDINGIIDDSSGTISGVASALLPYTHQIARLLLNYAWDGSNWTAGTAYDTTAFTTSQTISSQAGQYYRALGGRTDSRIGVDQLVAQIAEDTAFRITQRLNGKWASYAWGSNPASAATLFDDNATVTGVDVLGTESIVNHVQILSDRILVNLDTLFFFASKQVSNYQGALDWNYATNAWATAAITDSQTLYGNRELRDIEFNWLNNYSLVASLAPETMARYFMAVWGYPNVYVDIECSYFDFRTLELLDVITITHSDLPTHFGTSPNAKLPYSTTSSASCANIIGGHHWRRAKPYRAQIESRILDWSNEEMPVLKLRCKLLLNFPYDPT